MQMHTNVKVNVASVFDEREIPFMVSKDDGVFSGRVIVSKEFARGNFEREGSRVEVCVTKIEEFYTNTHYIVSIPNYFYSAEHNSLEGVAYKMREKTDWSKIDCESAQMAAVALGKMMNEIE